jgi:hypothetical protein
MSQRSGSIAATQRTCLIVCLLALAAVAGLQFTTTAATDSALPDLTIDPIRLQESLTIKSARFKAGDCAIQEGCVAGGGKRTLLKFDVDIWNVGAGDLLLGNPDPDDPVAGCPPADPDLFEFSPCHGHYHLQGFARYELYDLAETVLITGRKQAFCLRDNHMVVPGSGAAKFSCSCQGISAGWSDLYASSLDCQWLDITGVPAGTYVLSVTVNAESGLPESNFENNTQTAIVTIKK